MNTKRTLPCLLLAVWMITLLTACGSAEETGRNIGQWVRDFWNGLMEGCFGSILLPFMFGVVSLAALSRNKGK